MEMFHDSRSLDCRAPFGALKTGQSVRLRLYVRGDASQVTLRLWSGEETLVPMESKGLGVYEATVKMPGIPGLVWYDFRLEDLRGRRLYYGNARDKLGGVGAVYQDPPPAFRSRCTTRPFPPAYLTDGIMYQIFPTAFAAAKCRKASAKTCTCMKTGKTRPWSARIPAMAITSPPIFRRRPGGHPPEAALPEGPGRHPPLPEPHLQGPLQPSL